MIIMSIDASTKSTGIAIFNEDNLVYKDCLTATASWSLLKRIVAIVNKIKDVLDKYKVDKIILEEVHPEAAAANIKTWRALMWLQAAINLMLYEEYPTIEVDYLYPSEWRKYCKIKQGRGTKREELKAADIKWAQEQFNIENINDDIADAIGIGYGYLKQKEEKSHELNWE